MLRVLKSTQCRITLDYAALLSRALIDVFNVLSVKFGRWIVRWGRIVRVLFRGCLLKVNFLGTLLEPDSFWAVAGDTIENGGGALVWCLHN